MTLRSTMASLTILALHLQFSSLPADLSHVAFPVDYFDEDEDSDFYFPLQTGFYNSQLDDDSILLEYEQDANIDWYDPSISYSDWQKVAPYIIPNSHPAKDALDKIFTKTRASYNLESLQAAGFTTKGPGQWSHTIIARHPKLKGFLVKLIADVQPDIDDAAKVVERAEGAALAREIIIKHGFQDIIKVPRKWIYVLPKDPAPPAGAFPKRFILVAEDMNILPRKQNYAKWQSHSLTKHKLDAIFILLTEGGFYDLPYAFNLPFSKDGKIAIVDTEKFRGWPIPYYKLNQYLNSEMDAYWNLLIQQNGPK